MSSRYVFADAGVYCIQHTVSGTGVFDGTPVGYASYTYSAGGVSFKVRSPYLGTDANGVKLQLVAPVSNMPATMVEYDQAMRVLRVRLKGTATAITATASEVVDAINNMLRPVLYAGLISDGVVGALSPASLSGGLDPDLSASRGFPKFALAANANAGLFYFDQTRPWKVHAVGGQLSANQNPVTIEIVNVDRSLAVQPGRVLLSSQSVNNTNHDIIGSRLDFPLMPGQALLVNCGPHQGTVFVWAAPISSVDGMSLH